MDEIFIQHRFIISEDDLSYSDAIVLPLDEYYNLSDINIQMIKENRFNQWKIFLQTPPVVIPIADQIASIDQQIQELTQQKVALQAEANDVGNVMPVVIGGK